MRTWVHAVAAGVGGRLTAQTNPLVGTPAPSAPHYDEEGWPIAPSPVSGHRRRLQRTD